MKCEVFQEKNRKTLVPKSCINFQIECETRSGGVMSKFVFSLPYVWSWLFNFSNKISDFMVLIFRESRESATVAIRRKFEAIGENRERAS